MKQKSHFHYLPWMAGVLGFGLIVIQMRIAWRIPIGNYADDTLYILLARGLRTGAFRYPDVYAQPVTDPLPGWPSVLLLPTWLLEPHWGWMRLVPLLFMWIGLYFTWKLARELLSPGWATTVALLTGVSPALLSFSGVLIPDVPFAAASVVILYAFSKSRTRFDERWIAIGTAALALTRPQGTLLAMSLGLAIAGRAGLKRGVAFLALALSPLALWLLRNHLLAGISTNYVMNGRAQVLSLADSRSYLLHVQNLVAFLFGRGMLGLDGHSASSLTAGAALLALAGYGAVRRLKSGANYWLFAAATYVILLLSLHLVWRPVFGRYVIPMTPFVWLAAGAALEEWCRTSASRAIAGVALASLLIPPLILSIRRPKKTDTVDPETMAWIRDHTPTDARLEAFSPAVILLAQRPVVLLFMPIPDRDAWLYFSLKEGFQYALVLKGIGPAGFSTAEELSALYHLESWAESTPYAEAVYRNAAESSVLFRIRHPHPERFLAAYGDYLDAVSLLTKGSSGLQARRKLESALQLEPTLSSARVTLDGLIRRGTP